MKPKQLPKMQTVEVVWMMGESKQDIPASWKVIHGGRMPGEERWEPGSFWFMVVHEG